MDKNLTALKPALVWKHFARIADIPRPSHHEEKIRRYVLDCVRDMGLEHCEDEAHNIYVRKPATKGMEDRKGVILQAHLDMVPQKNNDKVFDFENDPIEAYIDGEWVTANGTTLGADNGIGAAAILAVLEDDTLVHGPLEALFTATEETGMDGAFGLKAGLLRGDILLNLDSETEGELYVGCAGGLDANIVFDYAETAVPAGDRAALRIEIKGLKGGHSGIQIGTQRGNANRLLFRFLREAGKTRELLLASVDGGGLRNAIMRSSVNTEKAALGEALSAVFELAGARVELTGSYDGWNPDMNSPILKAMTESYRALYGTAPAVTAIHAGLECGIIGSKYPKLDMISFGPTICYPHSPDEKVEIASVAKFYDFLVHTLGNSPVK